MIFKRIIVSLLVLTTLFATAGCGASSKSGDSNKKSYDPMVTVLLLTEKSFSSTKYLYEYNDDGNMTLEVCYYNGEESSRTEYKYDDAGNMTLLVSYNRGEENYRYEYEYDNDGNRTLEIYYENGVECCRYEYEYDDDGTIKSIPAFSYGGMTIYDTEYQAIRIKKSKAEELEKIRGFPTIIIKE